MFSVGIIISGRELSLLQLRSIFRKLGHAAMPDAECELPKHHCLALWTVMLIDRLKFLAPDQRVLLCDELLPDITKALVDDIERDLLQTPMVVIADGRYATWENRQGWLDLSNGATVASPRVPPLETMAYNLAVLYNRNRAACEILQHKATTNGPTRKL